MLSYIVFLCDTFHGWCISRPYGMLCWNKIWSGKFNYLSEHPVLETIKGIVTKITLAASGVGGFAQQACRGVSWCVIWLTKC